MRGILGKKERRDGPPSVRRLRAEGEKRGGRGILERAQLTFPCATGLYGLGQQMQHGTAPMVPRQVPKVAIMEPYQPCVDMSSVSGLMTWAYDGCRSSRRGGWTLMMGSSGLREEAPLGMSPRGALMVSPFMVVGIRV